MGSTTNLTARDKAILAANEQTKLQAELNTLTDTGARVNNIKTQISDVDIQLAFLSQQRQALVTSDPMGTNPTTQQSLDQIDAATTEKKSLRGQLSGKLTVLNNQLVIEKASRSTSATTKKAKVAKAVTATGTGAYKTINNRKNLPLYYNASSVREAYFSTRTDYLKRFMTSHNQPSRVTAATELWDSAAGSKGMIVTSEQVLESWNSGSNKSDSQSYFDNHNYGFQFQYNPGTVAMSYFTSPNVDVALMTSGTEMFNLAGVSGSQGSVAFQIVINRTLDMQYYDEFGFLKDSSRYAKPPKDAGEELELYRKGTMYDVEFLLRVLMGTTMSSYLRGEDTADMGWLPAIPVELHLGKSLRYLGTVNNISLNHMIFDERMVPLFTTVDIGFARLPDYPAKKVTMGR